MSTLRVSTIQDTAGSNSSTPAAIANGIAKAWVNFNGTGVVAIRGQYNVSSITDNGTGNYTVNFTTAMSDANYSAVVTVGRASGGTALVTSSPETSAPTTSTLQFITWASGYTAADSGSCNVAIFR